MLFILLLGFILQSVVVKATPYIEYLDVPTPPQYLYLSLACLLLYLIKILYVDDSYSIDPVDHALLVNRAAGFLFNLGQYLLLLASVVLGAGMDGLTSSFLSATAALDGNSRSLVCYGFGGAALAILFIKSMHVRRVPTDSDQARLFYTAYAVQVCTVLATAAVSFGMATSTSDRGLLALLVRDEVGMLGTLCGLALLGVVMSWLDEAVDLSLYGGGTSREYRVHPFGIWWFCRSYDVDDVQVAAGGQVGGGGGVGGGRTPPPSSVSLVSPLLGNSSRVSSYAGNGSTDSLRGGGIGSLLPV